MAALEQFDGILLHLSYSPDLAPCDLFPFPNLREHLKGHCYIWPWGASSCAHLVAGDDLRFISLWDAATSLMLAFACGQRWWLRRKIKTLKVKQHSKLSENVQFICKSSILLKLSYQRQINLVQYDRIMIFQKEIGNRFCKISHPHNYVAYYMTYCHFILNCQYLSHLKWHIRGNIVLYLLSLNNIFILFL